MSLDYSVLAGLKTTGCAAWATIDNGELTFNNVNRGCAYINGVLFVDTEGCHDDDYADEEDDDFFDEEDDEADE